MKRNTKIALLAASAALPMAGRLLLDGRRGQPGWDKLLDWRYAHRGLHDNNGGVPENSLAAFRLAAENGFGVLIAAAGKAAHLAGALAAQTVLPVIGIPVKSSTLDGLDALLSTVQMPSGMPVATVAIDGAANAALLAAQILAVEDAELTAKLRALRQKQHDAVVEKDRKLVID